MNLPNDPASCPECAAIQATHGPGVACRACYER